MNVPKMFEGWTSLIWPWLFVRCCCRAAIVLKNRRIMVDTEFGLDYVHNSTWYDTATLSTLLSPAANLIALSLDLQEKEIDGDCGIEI